MALVELKTSRTHTYSAGDKEEWTREYYCGFTEAEGVVPMPGELMDASSAVWCQSTVITPFGTDQAKVVVTYSNQAGSLDTQEEIDQIEESLDISSEVATTTVEDDGAGTPVEGAAMTIIRPIAKYRLSVTRGELISIMSILANIGKVNMLPWRGADPGTMLFMGCSLRRRSENTWRAEYTSCHNNDDRHKTDVNGVDVPKGWNNPVDKAGKKRTIYGLGGFSLLELED